jgi:hypothetical protein
MHLDDRVLGVLPLDQWGWLTRLRLTLRTI